MNTPIALHKQCNTTSEATDDDEAKRCVISVAKISFVYMAVSVPLYPNHRLQHIGRCNAIAQICFNPMLFPLHLVLLNVVKSCARIVRTVERMRVIDRMQNGSALRPIIVPA